MNCPKCGIHDPEPVEMKQVSDETNKFGRRQITWTVKTLNWIQYIPESKSYHCNKCGSDFTSKEYTSQ